MRLSSQLPVTVTVPADRFGVPRSVADMKDGELIILKNPTTHFYYALAWKGSRVFVQYGSYHPNAIERAQAFSKKDLMMLPETALAKLKDKWDAYPKRLSTKINNDLWENLGEWLKQNPVLDLELTAREWTSKAVQGNEALITESATREKVTERLVVAALYQQRVTPATITTALADLPKILEAYWQEQGLPLAVEKNIVNRVPLRYQTEENVIRWDNDRTPLILKAAKAGKLENIPAALVTRKTLTCFNFADETPLHVLASTTSLQRYKALLKPEDMLLEDMAGNTPLSLSALNGKLYVLPEELTDWKSLLKPARNGTTALGIAAKSYHFAGEPVWDKFKGLSGEASRLVREALKPHQAYLHTTLQKELGYEAIVEPKKPQKLLNGLVDLLSYGERGRTVIRNVVEDALLKSTHPAEQANDVLLALKQTGFLTKQCEPAVQRLINPEHVKVPELGERPYKLGELLAME